MFGFFTKNKFDSIDVNDLEALLGKVSLIDIREPYEYMGGHLPTARNVPMGRLMMESELHLDKDQPYYIICQSGARSARTCAALKEKGYEVINVAGGTGSYRRRLAV